MNTLENTDRIFEKIKIYYFKTKIRSDTYPSRATFLAYDSSRFPSFPLAIFDTLVTYMTLVIFQFTLGLRASINLVDFLIAPTSQFYLLCLRWTRGQAAV